MDLDPRHSQPRTHLTVAVGALLTAFTLIYLPFVGHGFVKDDFGWIARSPLASWHDAGVLFVTSPSGFFRPMVSLSFGINRWFCGLTPLCYGLTNFALVLACGAAIYALARGLGLPQGAAVFASAVWLFNWHGINMATLWTSGRTALLAVLFGVTAAASLVRGRYALAAALALTAMLSKEEGVLVPAVLLAWLLIARRPLAGVIPFIVSSAAAEAFYLFLRARSGAFTPGSAPPFYQLSFTLSRVLDNLPGYFDRTATFTLVVLALGAVVCRPAWSALRRADVRMVAFGAIWWVGTLAITVFLPVRSSLYACLPSIGIVLIGAALVTAAWPAVTPDRQRRAVWAGLLLPFALWPLYYTRNRPSVREAELSARTIQTLQDVARERGGGVVVLLNDDRSVRPTLDNAFGTVLPVAVDLMVSPRLTAWIDPPPVDAALAGLQTPSHIDVRYALRNGELVKEP